MSTPPAIFCAADTADLERACNLARIVGPVTGGIKLGLELFNAHGPQGLETVMNACPEAAYFIDLKYHDIPNTVAGAVRALTGNLSPYYLNVHASGGSEMMQAAREACHSRTRLLSVTILTSIPEKELCKIGYREGMADRVVQMAKLAQDNGLDGVVCSAHEIETLRRECGPDFDLVVPGIRPAGSAKGDQKRVMTPNQAMQLGATSLVIGRPITESPDPAQAAQEILQTLQK